MNYSSIDNLIYQCPECGSGDIHWDTLSIRPHCVECNYWGPINYERTVDSAVLAWNKRVQKDSEAKPQSAIMISIDSIVSKIANNNNNVGKEQAMNLLISSLNKNEDAIVKTVSLKISNL